MALGYRSANGYKRRVSSRHNEEIWVSKLTWRLVLVQTLLDIRVGFWWSHFSKDSPLGSILLLVALAQGVVLLLALKDPEALRRARWLVGLSIAVPVVPMLIVCLFAIYYLQVLAIVLFWKLPGMIAWRILGQSQPKDSKIALSLPVA